MEESEDRYRPSAVMPAGRWIAGRFKGRAIDVSERRALIRLPAAEAGRYQPAAGEILAANFIHDGRFWIAKFPADAVDKVIFQKWNFGETRFFYVAHTELRFQLRPGRAVVLYPQTGPRGVALSADEAARISDVVCSLEAVGVPGQSFNIWGGLVNHFVGVRRFKSLEENFFERVLRERRTIEQWEVVLADDRKQALFRATIEDSHAMGMSALYHVVSRSCTTEAFRIIDSVMSYGYRTWRSKTFRRVPHFPEAYLWARGLLRPGGASRLPTLDEEKAAWKTAPSMRERLSRYRDLRRAGRETSPGSTL